MRNKRQFLDTYSGSTRRSIATNSSRISHPLPSLCHACSKLDSKAQTLSLPQRRFQSSHASTQTSPNANTPPTTPRIPQTHYEFFPKTLSAGPPPNGPFHIDLRELRREFLQLQAVAHPDRHSHHNKIRAEATSARINEAYKTLQSPLLRAQYLLGLRGVNVADDETAKVADPDLLMEVLEAREEIEGARSEEDLVELKRVNEERIGRSEEVLERAFREDDLRKAGDEAVSLRYWVNIRESLHAWEEGKPITLAH
ncbi:putative chaperone [Tricladium varicosporioides]|nr:putative chaperone [Hymenoscyphus varicosporioides]